MLMRMQIRREAGLPSSETLFMTPEPAIPQQENQAKMSTPKERAAGKRRAQEAPDDGVRPDERGRPTAVMEPSLPQSVEQPVRIKQETDAIDLTSDDVHLEVVGIWVPAGTEVAKLRSMFSDGMKVAMELTQEKTDARRRLREISIAVLEYDADEILESYKESWNNILKNVRKKLIHGVEEVREMYEQKNQHHIIKANLKKTLSESEALVARFQEASLIRQKVIKELRALVDARD